MKLDSQEAVSLLTIAMGHGLVPLMRRLTSYQVARLTDALALALYEHRPETVNQEALDKFVSAIEKIAVDLEAS